MKTRLPAKVADIRARQPSAASCPSDLIFHSTQGRIAPISVAPAVILNSPGHHLQNSDAVSSAASVSLGGLIVVIAFGVACLGFHWLSEEGWFPVLDSANLAVHEAGHPLVSVFSARATVYGGTLFQLAFPLAAAWHFYRAANASGTAAAIVWLGENLFNVARYMADARARQLPLVGNGEHDWAEIFSRWGVLNLDGRIAGVTGGIGAILIVGAAAWLYRRWRADKEYSAT